MVLMNAGLSIRHLTEITKMVELFWLTLDNVKRMFQINYQYQSFYLEIDIYQLRVQYIFSVKIFRFFKTWLASYANCLINFCVALSQVFPLIFNQSDDSIGISQSDDSIGFSQSENGKSKFENLAKWIENHKIVATNSSIKWKKNYSRFDIAQVIHKHWNNCK